MKHFMGTALAALTGLLAAAASAAEQAKEQSSTSSERSPARTHRVQNEYFKVAVVVGDWRLGGHTYLSEP